MEFVCWCMLWINMICKKLYLCFCATGALCMALMQHTWFLPVASRSCDCFKVVLSSLCLLLLCSVRRVETTWETETPRHVVTSYVFTSFVLCRQGQSTATRYVPSFSGKSVLDYLRHPSTFPTTYNIQYIMYNCIYLNVSFSPRVSNFKTGQVTQCTCTSEQTSYVMLRWKRKEAQPEEGEFPAFSWDATAMKSAFWARSTPRDQQCLACSCYFLEVRNDHSQEDSDSEDMNISSSTARPGTGKHGRSPVVPVFWPKS